jgi:hypothetical protein
MILSSTLKAILSLRYLHDLSRQNVISYNLSTRYVIDGLRREFRRQKKPATGGNSRTPAESTREREVSKKNHA